MEEEREYTDTGRDESAGEADDGTETAEGERSEEVSEDVPEELSGEGATPLGDTGEHSDAPGPHGTGPLYEDD